ncbi:hypothetical protein [Ammoniphilus sp. CFH 90114]|uniref:hypothetical protein n=1 Tax=Ammoniphilus sp. CFH 90114 TaxID=2493665 RepID=UPI00100F4659|nr:hypothetical protein [Ammoniphilus sp. CFH 90114]RXT15284.1 hypothetical protein EIZ39_03490 [Ammoniphilus sp. CFH 90114]
MSENKNNLKEQAYEQLAEKQIEEIDRMQALRYGLPLPTHTTPEVQSQVFSELFSGIPISDDKKDDSR